MPELTPDIEVMNDHFTKFHIRGPGLYEIPDFGAAYFGVPGVVHRFTNADGYDADFHDHPWSFTSHILKGGYLEEILDLGTGAISSEERLQRQSFHIEAGHIHRIVTLLGPECWTFIQPGPPDRKSSFYRVMHRDRIERRFWDEAAWQVVPRPGERGVAPGEN